MPGGNARALPARPFLRRSFTLAFACIVSTRRQYVARATADLGWRIWNTKTKRWWGEYFKRYPDELLAELNGEKRSARVAERTRQLQTERRHQAQPKRVK